MAYERLNCEHCDKEFYAKTRKAKYCSDACRQASYRVRVENGDKSKKFMMTLEEGITLRMLSDFNPEAARMLKAAWQGGHYEVVKALLVIPSYHTFIEDLFRVGYWHAVTDAKDAYQNVTVNLI